MYSVISRIHSLLPGFVLPMKNVFGLQRAPETFHGRVVVAVALAAHRGAYPEAVQQTPERTGAVLAAAVHMMQHAGRRPLGRHSAQQGLADQMLGHAPCHGVADDLPGVQILGTSELEPPLNPPDHGEKRPNLGLTEFHCFF